MKFKGALAMAAILLVGCQPDEKAEKLDAEKPPLNSEAVEMVLPDPSEADIVAARMAAKQLGGELKAQLVAAIEAEGPVGGVNVCAEVADDIAARVSEETGMSVGRTALRTRNKANEPDPWERQNLEDMRQMMAEVEGGVNLERIEVVERDGQPVFRWMAPIMMGDVCTTCHGADVSDDVLAVVAEHYPDDAATGFQPGELRGAFTVEKVLN